ncbi:MAG TPA: VWA domain-containing protein [Bryobacteraceae bacterium]|jgi:VWFA-related protein|nr:VWA domain-containing protein [Bryobacteraceae bacterium]
MPNARFLVVVTVALCGLPQLYPQSDGPATTPTAPPTLITDNVDEIATQIVVRDKHGRALRDLTPEEIKILDDGKPTKLKTLIPGAPAGSFRLVTLLWNADQPDHGASVYQAASELVKSADPDTYLSAWKLGARLELVSDFTKDREAFAVSIKIATVGLKRNERRVVKPGVPPTASPVESDKKKLDVLPAQEVSDLAVQMAAEKHLTMWIACLSALTAQQASVPGRKEILHFFTGSENQSIGKDQVNGLIADANRAGVAIYPIDVSGLSAKLSAEAAGAMAAGQLAGQTESAAQAQARGGVSGPSASSSSTLHPVMNAPMRSGEFDNIGSHPESQRNGYLRQIARQTSGLYVAESNNLRQSMHLIGEDLESFYSLTYAPVNEALDGHFRAISVTIDRAHTLVQSRDGYFAVPMAGAIRVEPFEIPLIKALDGNASRQGANFDAQVLRFGHLAGHTNTVLAIQVPLRDLQSYQDQTEKILKLHFSILGLIRTPDGRVIQKLSQDVPYEVAEERASSLQQDTFHFDRHFALAAGDYWAELAVQDRNSGAIATRLIHFTISDEKSQFGLSDIAVLERMDSHAESVSDPQDPLQYGNERALVNPSPAVSADSRGVLPLYLTIYPDPAVKTAPKLAFEILLDGKSVGRLPIKVELTSPDRPKTFVASLPEKALVSGHYTLIATAAQGSATLERRREFDFSAASGEAADLGESEHLFLTPLPPLSSAVNRPDAAEIDRILSAARQRALEYQDGLPNFSCLEVTRRFADRTGKEEWKQRDVIAEVLRYTSGAETYQTLAINGERTSLERDRITGVRTSGEFGQLLSAVFSKEAGAAFEWQGEAHVNGASMQVFKYSVPQQRSRYKLKTEDGLKQTTPAFHGLVYIDANTYAIHHVSLQAEAVPEDFPTRESDIAVDYGFVTIGDQKYLLPLSATLRIRKGKRMLFKNDMQYRDYRRFTADSKFVQ